MLLEFRCSNHRSIRDEVLFSAIAGSDKTHAENIESFPVQLSTKMLL